MFLSLRLRLGYLSHCRSMRGSGAGTCTFFFPLLRTSGGYSVLYFMITVSCLHREQVLHLNPGELETDKVRIVFLGFTES